MKDTNGKDLQQPYYDLAVMRREKLKNTIWGKTWHSEFDKNNELDFAFPWRDTPEGYDWWLEVNKNNHPTIPQSSLDELEAWRANKVIEALSKPADTTDWKAKYEELLQKHTDLFKIHQNACAEHDAVTELTTGHNFIAECAMRAMQGMLSDPSMTVLPSYVLQRLELPEDTEYNWLIHYPQYVAKISFIYAEAMAAEGKNRGHIN